MSVPPGGILGLRTPRAECHPGVPGARATLHVHGRTTVARPQRLLPPYRTRTRLLPPSQGGTQGGRRWRCHSAIPFCVFLSGALFAFLPGCKPADPKEQFTKLESEMEKAYDEYVEAMRKRLERLAEPDAQKSPVPPEPAPAATDRRVEILVRMDSLAEQTAGQAGGGEISVKTFVWSAAFRLDPNNLLARFDRIAKHHPDEDGVVEALSLVPDVHSLSGTPQQWIDRLQTIAAAAQGKDAKVAALFALGQLHMAARQLELAKPAFEQVVLADPASPYSELSKSYVYEIDHLQPGMASLDFSAVALSGQQVALQDFRGKVVLLDFWASWCAPCLGELPHLKAAAERFADAPFVILGVSLDDFREMLESTVQQQGVPGVQTWDESGRENKVAELYNAQVLPTWYLIDQKGIIRARDPFGEKLIPAVKALLDNPPEE